MDRDELHAMAHHFRDAATVSGNAMGDGIFLMLSKEECWTEEQARSLTRMLVTMCVTSTLCGAINATGVISKIAESFMPELSEQTQMFLDEMMSVMENELGIDMKPNPNNN
jgi:hypothetical protein